MRWAESNIAALRPDVVAALAAGLLDEMDLAQLHALIDGLTHIVDGEQAVETPVRASISTPVTPAVLTVQSASTACRSGRSLKSTLTFVRGSGWHSGMSSLVRLVAMIPAMRATPSTSPFFHGAALHSGECLGVMVMMPWAVPPGR